MIPTCKDRVIVLPNGRKYVLSCFGCSTNLLGDFSSVTVGGIGGLTQTGIPYATGIYRERNKVKYYNSTAQTITSPISRIFKLPMANINCNGKYEFVITAIVHFDDCSVCYVSESYGYIASWHWNSPNLNSTINR